jgi:hypothetical protein
MSHAFPSLNALRTALTVLLAGLGGTALVVLGTGTIRDARAASAAAGYQGTDTTASASTSAGGGGMENMQGAKDAGGADHSQMDHAAMGHDHAMTPEQMKELREKIPLYAVFTDEQIVANMGRMPPDWWEDLSAAGVKGKVGLLVLGHGYSRGGNEQFKEKLAPLGKLYPTAVAPGMAMMSGNHIQKALDTLTNEHGVKTVVVVPVEPGDETSLIGQWKFILGMADEAPYLTVPRVKTDARLVMTKSPSTDPRMATILRDHAVEVAKDPAKSRLVIVSHGPETVAANPGEIQRLLTHADAIKGSSKFADVQVLSLQDDAIPEVRAANKAVLRAMIIDAKNNGEDVIIVPMILTRGGFHARLQKDLEGLDYKFADRGLIEHPAFQEWIAAAVKGATRG